MQQEAELKAEPGRRRSSVRRRWKRADGWRAIGDQKRFWDTLDPGLMGFVVALLACVLALPLELTLWGWSWDLWGFGVWVEGTGSVLAGVFLTVWYLNGRILGRLAIRRLPALDAGSPSRWWLFRVLLGFPLVGAHLLAVMHRRWGALGEPSPASLRSLRLRNPRALRRGDGTGRRRGWGLRQLGRRWRTAVGWFLPWFLVSIAVLVWAVGWLSGQRGEGVRPTLALTAAGLHLMAFAGLWSGGEARVAFSARQRWEARIHRFAAGFFLLPHPAPLLGLVIHLADPLVETARALTLVRAACRLRPSVDCVHRWRLQGSGERVRPKVGLTPLRTQVTQRRGDLYRLMTGLTFFDAVLLARLSVEGRRAGWLPARMLEYGAAAMPGWTLVAVTVGLGGFLLCQVVALLPVSWSPMPEGLPLAAKFLAWNAVALGIGFESGLSLAMGELHLAALWLALPIGLLLSLWALGLMLRPVYRSLAEAVGARDGLDPTFRLVWVVPPLLLMAAAVPLAAGGSNGREMADLLLSAAGWAPLAHGVMAFTYGRWLLRPFGWWELVRRGLPGAQRLRLLAGAATLLVPLGGLAVPGWILVRR